MKTILFGLLVLINTMAFGQINLRTGDATLEAELNEANKQALKDLPSFKLNVSREYSVATPKIEGFLKIMKPAELILAFRISSIVRKPIDSVVESYRVNKTKGWGFIAKEMGIKPGSPEFHALKGKGKSTGKPSNGNGNSHGNSNGKGKK
jgi:hypothetical protein